MLYNFNTSPFAMPRAICTLKIVCLKTAFAIVVSISIVLKWVSTCHYRVNRLRWAQEIGQYCVELSTTVQRWSLLFVHCITPLPMLSEWTAEFLADLCEATFHFSLKCHVILGMSFNMTAYNFASTIYRYGPFPHAAMMTSSNGNIFRVTCTLGGEFNGHWWILLTKASDA